MLRTGESPLAGADRRGVLALLRALADSGLDLAHNTARLAACEGRMVLHRLATRAGMALAGLLAAAAGFHLVLVGAALGLAEVTGWDRWMAFVLVGLVALCAGAAVAILWLRRLGDEDLLFPGTLAELEEDVRALRRETGESGDPAP